MCRPSAIEELVLRPVERRADVRAAVHVDVDRVAAAHGEDAKLRGGAAEREAARRAVRNLVDATERGADRLGHSAERLLDRRDEGRIVGRRGRREARLHPAVAADDELAEVPLDVAGSLGRRVFRAEPRVERVSRRSVDVDLRVAAGSSRRSGPCRTPARRRRCRAPGPRTGCTENPALRDRARGRSRRASRGRRIAASSRTSTRRSRRRRPCPRSRAATSPRR